MSNSCDIWVEGIADQKFLTDVLLKWFDIKCIKTKVGNGAELFSYRNEKTGQVIKIRSSGTVEAFVSMNEWEKKKPDFLDNNNQGIKNLIIADADENFEERKKAIESTVTEVGFDVGTNLFLWPDNQNNAGKGDLENLLVQIINPENQPIFDCWEAYENCLNQTPRNYTTPARKTKIYGYLEALHGESNSEKEKIKERSRDYTNENHWTLNGDIPPLKPLMDFLQMHLFPAENQ